MKTPVHVLPLACLLLPAVAAAEPLPAGADSQKAATSGKTDVATGDKFEAPAAKPADDAKDTQEAQILAGALLATGNARSLSTTASGSYLLRRSANQFSAVAAVNYARAAADASSGVKTTVENYQGKARYDRFLAASLAAFLSVSGRRDRFQGLDLRLNVDPGLAYYFVDQEHQAAWGELGYDFQLDLRRQETIDAAIAAGEPAPDKTQARHAGRAYVGYRNSLNESVALTTGLEYLQAFIPDTKSWRINWDAGITSKIGGNFSLATTFTLKYDHNPLPGVKNTDTFTAVSLVYQLL